MCRRCGGGAVAEIVNNVSWWPGCSGSHAGGMKVAHLLHSGCAALDVVGAFQVLPVAPGTNDARDLCS
jgi:hypothetical protein